MFNFSKFVESVLLVNEATMMAPNAPQSPANNIQPAANNTKPTQPPPNPPSDTPESTPPKPFESKGFKDFVKEIVSKNNKDLADDITILDAFGYARAYAGGTKTYLPKSQKATIEDLFPIIDLGYVLWKFSQKKAEEGYLGNLYTDNTSIKSIIDGTQQNHKTFVLNKFEQFQNKLFNQYKPSEYICPELKNTNASLEALGMSQYESMSIYDAIIGITKAKEGILYKITTAKFTDFNMVDNILFYPTDYITGKSKTTLKDNSLLNCSSSIINWYKSQIKIFGIDVALEENLKLSPNTILNSIGTSAANDIIKKDYVNFLKGINNFISKDTVSAAVKTTIETPNTEESPAIETPTEEKLSFSKFIKNKYLIEETPANTQTHPMPIVGDPYIKTVNDSKNKATPIYQAISNYVVQIKTTGNIADKVAAGAQAAQALAGIFT